MNQKLAGNEETEPINIAATVHALVRSIAPGTVLSYGELGALCNPPISGYICGRYMNGAPADVPWWRVVAKDGSLSVGRRDPALAAVQRELLQDEGVTFANDGRVNGRHFRQGIRCP